MKIKIPELSLVVLIGASSSGKSTFAREHFLETEVLSSDFCRALVSDDENEPEATKDAFEILHFIAGKRLQNQKLVVVDATNIQKGARKPLIELARKFHVLPVAIILDMPEKVCWERSQKRSDRDMERRVIRGHCQQLQKSIRSLKREGFRQIYHLTSLTEVANASVERQRLWNNRKYEHGPFDIIGDIHGCGDELEELLGKLGYQIDEATQVYQHPEERQVIFLGDLMDRGPRSLDVYQLVKRMVGAKQAICVPGNHDTKLIRWLRGKDVRITYGLETTVAEIEALPADQKDAYKKEMQAFLYSLVSHYVLDDGRLVVAHAGMKEDLQGRASGKVRDFALYGETTGESDAFGLPIRYNWAAEYRGAAMVVYGHTPVPEAAWLNKTINIDTGCVFGGKLTALRYPEKELVSVPAKFTYADPIRPLVSEAQELEDFSSQQSHDDLLRIEDVTGKRIVTTSLRGNIAIREENSIAALEVMSRFAANPKWLIYLPPTMSPSATSKLPDYLEHPAEAFSYFRKQGISKVICQKKHMGSRAIVIVCKDAEAAKTRFGIQTGEIGICYTRTGRHFFNDEQLETAFLARLQKALTKADWWKKFATDWVCLDSELMPWSVKAQDLLQQQYAAVGAAAHGAMASAIQAIEKTAEKNDAVRPLLDLYQTRQEMASQYIAAYGHYCWPVNSLDDLQLAPFHIMATEGVSHVEKDHLWHMETIAELCQVDPQLLLATDYKVLDMTQPEEIEAGVEWWLGLTSAGGEGMVVKPLDFIAKKGRSIIQPAIKSRGREYLRIIYGPEYSLPENLERLRSRGLSGKRSLALREFSLGVEGLARFVNREPLYRVHECVFGVLALESEPVDPRL